MARLVTITLGSSHVVLDGKRFLMLRQAAEPVQSSGATQVFGIEIWFEELNRLAPPSP